MTSQNKIDQTFPQIIECQVLVCHINETETFAQQLSKTLKVTDCIALQGDLGAGKTTFSRALIRELMQDSELIVPSPTFSIMQQYTHNELKIIHCDFYRLSDPDELDIIGFKEISTQAISLIEWPENAPSFIPQDAIILTFKENHDDDNRVIFMRKIVHNQKDFQEYIENWADFHPISYAL